jgi:DNA invertase Pin-like site-specific DNA recombinase
MASTRAFSYIRFSSARQMGNDSVRRQRDLSATLAARKGWVMDESLRFEDEACSGFKSKNANVGRLAEFLSAIEGGTVPAGSVLIVESLDRLSRDEIGTALQLWLRILGAGVSIATVEPERVYGPDSSNNLASLLEALVIMSRAHEESALKSARVRQSWAARKQAARETGRKMTKTRPYWIDLDEKGDFVLNPTHQDTIRQIVAWCKDGLGMMRIRQRLEAEPQKYPCFARKGAWTEEYLRWLIKSPLIWGGIQLNEDAEPIPDYYPPAVDKPTADEAKLQLLSRRRHGGRPGQGETCLFTGLLWHAPTRGRMRVRCGENHGKPYRTLVATDAGQSASIAKGTATLHPPVEDAILGMLEELTAADLKPVQPRNDAESLHEQAKQELKAARERVAALQARLSDPREEKDVVEMLMPSFRNAVAEVRSAEEKERLAGTAAMRAKDANLERTQSAVRCLRRAKPDELPELRRRAKTAIASLVESIWLYFAPANPGEQAVHIHVHFRSGGMKPVVIPPRKPGDGVLVPNLDGVDFRNGYPPTKTTSSPGPKRRSNRGRKATAAE